ncbi:MAG: alpha-galactosidase, partial [Acidobacteriota bacterium]
MKLRTGLIVLLLLVGCQGSESEEQTRVSAGPDGEVVLTHGELQLSLDTKLGLTVSLAGRSIVEPPGEAFPLNVLTVDGGELRDFVLSSDPPLLVAISDQHGTGSQIDLSALASTPEGIQVRQDLKIRVYDRYPTLAILDISYTNLDQDRALTVNQTISGQMRLNAQRAQPESAPYDFHTFQGGSYEWGRSYAGIPITQAFNQQNLMGLYTRANFDEDEDEGGGINLIDVWNRTTGLALCHLGTRDLFVSFPTRTDEQGLVHIQMEEEPDPDLGDQPRMEPGATYRVQAPIGIIAHQGDYFEPLKIYRDLLVDQGIQIQSESPQWTYQSYWKTWGWQRDFTLQMVYERIPQLLELGIRQLQIDDGWQDHVGDWNPNREKYPQGEAGMIASVQKMKSLGIERVYLWWNPLGVNTDSEMARKTEWLVLGKDGAPPTSRQHTLCPAYPPVQEHIRSLVRKWISEWGYDGVYNDFAMNSVAPACINPAPGHVKPTDAFAATPEIWRIIWEEAHALHTSPFVETCICSLPHSLFKNPYTNMTSASDPLTNLQVRARIKVEKATHGPRWAYTNCYIEEGRRDPLPALSDADFASSVGIGSILATLYAELTPEEFSQYRKWFQIYFREMVSSGEYLNLYDIIYDRPEAHAIRKDGVMYYGFYADSWNGPLELRGLEARQYQVLDYVEIREL